MEEQSSWQEKLRALGPGILMASAAVGGSHIIMSTQAGANYGWQLLAIVLLANLFKYPFFRFGMQYTLATRKSLIEGYWAISRAYLYLFFILNVIAEVINIAGVAIVTAAILKFMLPPSLNLPIGALANGVIVGTFLILLLGRYKLLDRLSKLIMICLTVSTVVAVLLALNKGAVMRPDFVEPSPWTWAGFAFIVPLMGWMPAPIEISAINSMWVVAQQQERPVKYDAGIFDFNTGYIGTAILAVIFVALGALTQYGSGTVIEKAGVAYIGQLVQMYGSVIGAWAKPLIAFIAFLCMFGTTITVIDGYSRANGEALRLILNQDQASNRNINGWMLVCSLAAMAIVQFFMGDVKQMLDFAMIMSFVFTPIFAWLNLQLVSKGEHGVGRGKLYKLSLLGLLYLSAFTLVFLFQYFFAAAPK